MKKRTPKGKALTSLILETFQLNGALLAAGNRITKPFGLTSARWQVMGAIDLAEHPLTVAQIARRMGLTRQGVQRTANNLKDLGMVVFETNLDHKNASLVTITEAGKKAMAEIDTAQIVWVNQLSEGTNERLINQAIKLLETIRERSDGIDQP